LKADQREDSEQVGFLFRDGRGPYSTRHQDVDCEMRAA
jgi:hypothetical protein